MRSIFVGVEYAGKSTLIGLLGNYYQHRKLRTHGDDHFTLPDASLSPESRKELINYPEDVKERMQRMQIHYHVDIIKKYEYPLLGGWHIEEWVYDTFYGKNPDSPYYGRYNYHFQRLYESLVLDAHLPDVVLIHVKADKETIAQRMQETPHEYQIIHEKDVEELQKLFDEEVSKSLFTHQGRLVELDTTGKTAEESFDELLKLTEPLITTAEMALRAVPVPEGAYEVVYEAGVRKMVPQEG